MARPKRTWQPIETAHNGLVQLTDGGYVITGFKQGDQFLAGWISGDLSVRIALQPTHWMDLPDPPKPLPTPGDG